MRQWVLPRNTTYRASIIAAIWIAAGVAGCRSTGRSDAKDISLNPNDLVNEADWVQSCDAELTNPATSESAKADLMRLTGQTDCRVAYPIVRSIVQNYLAKP